MNYGLKWCTLLYVLNKHWVYWKLVLVSYTFSVFLSGSSQKQTIVHQTEEGLKRQHSGWVQHWALRQPAYQNDPQLGQEVFSIFNIWPWVCWEGYRYQYHSERFTHRFSQDLLILNSFSSYFPFSVQLSGSVYLVHFWPSLSLSSSFDNTHSSTLSNWVTCLINFGDSDTTVIIKWSWLLHWPNTWSYGIHSATFSTIKSQNFEQEKGQGGVREQEVHPTMFASVRTSVHLRYTQYTYMLLTHSMLCWKVIQIHICVPRRHTVEHSVIWLCN